MYIVDLEYADQRNGDVHENKLLEEHNVDGEDDEGKPLGELVAPQSGVGHRDEKLQDHQDDGEPVEALEFPEQDVQLDGENQVDYWNVYKVEGRVMCRELVIDLVAHHNAAIEKVDE